MDTTVAKQIEEILDNYYSRAGYCKRCPLADKERGIHFYNDSFKQNKILIFQNPGEGRSEEDKEKSSKIKSFMKARDMDQLVKVCQEAFKGWKTDFFSDFFDTLKEREIVNFDTFNTYKRTSNLFRDFYITDVVKCVAKTGEIYGKPEQYCSNYLKKELLKKISKTSDKRVLIFTFGNVAYRFFQNSKIFELKKVFGKTELHKDEPVTKRHGYLHLYTNKGIEGREKEFYVIHLTHLSKRARIFTLRESYFDYLKEGLQSYQGAGKLQELDSGARA